MPTAVPEYIEDPTDRLLARVVGAWAKDKQFYLGRYQTIFANAMRAKWDWLCYLDLFSGPGTCVIEGSGDFYEGSALSAMARPFTDFIFVDKDGTAINALRKRTAPLALGRSVTFIERDCNDAIGEITKAVPQRALTLAFLDPTNWQVRFDTVRKLVDQRAIDVILTFHGGMLKRVSHLDQPRVDAFFGTDRWKPAKGETAHLYDLCEVYREQMATLGFADHAPPIDPKMKTSTNTPLYHLLFFSRNEKGHDFWAEVVAVSPSGQMNLFSAPAKAAKRRQETRQ